MSILTWIEDKKRLKILAAPKQHPKTPDSSKGLWTRCDKCGVILYIKHLKEAQRVCFGCGYHLQMMSGERIESLLDRTPLSNSPPLKGSLKNSASCTTRTNLLANRRFALVKQSKSEDKSSCKASTPLTCKASPCVTFAKQKCAEQKFARPGVSRDGTVSTWNPLDETLSPCDPLSFHDQKAYGARLEDAQERTGLQDAIQTGTGMIDGIPVALAVMDFSFMGGSMGSVVGEKITRLIEYATGEGLTLIIVSASGGARMQEGVFSLMQMAKISSALQIHQICANLLYISVLTSPTTGGVTASFAMLGDIVLAEPKALIAFAGRRVIEQTLREDLPDDFQTSEYMLHHGLVDLIVPRRFLRQALSETIRLYQNAPFKKRGQIPFGVQNPISFLAEEKVRRQWGTLTKCGTKPLVFSKACSAALQGRQSEALHNKTPCKSKICTCKASASRASLLRSKSVRSKSVQSFASRFVRQTQSKKPYREILTSFEAMLNLFVSGNGKKAEQSKRALGSKAFVPANRSLKLLFPGAPSSTQIVAATKKEGLDKALQGIQSSAPTTASRASLLRSKSVRSKSEGNLTKPSFVCTLLLRKSGARDAKLAKRCKPSDKTGFLSKEESRNRFSQKRTSENGSIPISPLETKDETNQRCKGVPVEGNPKDQFSRRDQRSRSHLLHSFRSFSEVVHVDVPYKAYKAPLTFALPCTCAKQKCAKLCTTKLLANFCKAKVTRASRTSANLRFASRFVMRSFASLLRSKSVRSLARVHTNTNQKFVSSFVRLPSLLLRKSVRSKSVQSFALQIVDLYVSPRSFVTPLQAFLGLQNFNYVQGTQSSLQIKDLYLSALQSKALQTRSYNRFTLQQQNVSLYKVQRTSGIAKKTPYSCKNSCKKLSKRVVLGGKAACPFGQKLKRSNNGASLQNLVFSESLLRSPWWQSPTCKASKKSSEDSKKNDISFLNQAIELAATESVEWRAFYIHQQLSENMGFLEDFLQKDPDSQRKTSNVLFYKAVCRSRKAIDE